MTKRQTEIPEFYTPDEYGRMAEVLGISELSAAQIKELQTAALNYWILFEFEIERSPDAPAPRMRREAVARVSKAAQELKNALDDQSLPFIERLQWPALKEGALEDLAVAATQTANLLAEKAVGGRPPKNGRLEFVRRLATLFEDFTNRRATRQHSSYKVKDCGPFLDFVIAAVGPVNKDEITGIDNVVRKVTSERSKDRPG